MVLLTTEKKKYNQQLTIEDVYEYCNREEVKFKFIGNEEDLKNSKSKLLFLCLKCQDEFSRDIGEIKRKNITQCQSCNRKDRGDRQMKDAFKEVLSLCDEIGLKCLSPTYNGNEKNLEFECTECLQPFNRRPSVLKIDKVTICRDCSYKKMISSLKYSYEEVSSIFQEGGCTLLSKEYKSNKQKLDYICECGEGSTIALSNFLYGQRCESCARIKRANTKRTSYEEVRKIFEDEECTLVSSEFIHSNIPLDYICSCGNPSKIKLPAFKYGVRCRKCGGNEKNEYSLIKECFEENGCELVSTEYINNREPLEFICSCGECSRISWKSYDKSPYKKCLECSLEMYKKQYSGKNHHSWNPDLTDEERMDRRQYAEYSIWRTSVYERDNYTCQCCGDTGDINAHHKDGCHWCKERRVDVSNGTTLCDKCHKDFHGKNGYKNNTEQQLVDYLDKYSTIER